MDLFEKLKEEKIIAILRGMERAVATRTAEALINGGIRIIEVPMNGEKAEILIAEWQERYQSRGVVVGAGTVLNLPMAKKALEAGAQFFFSPNLDEDVVRFGMEHGVSVWPGVMTPTEMVKAWTLGVQAVKLFPMSSLGVGYLQEVMAPLSHIPVIATGGIGLGNLQDYLSNGAIAAGIGSQLADKRLVSEGRYEELTKHAERFVNQVKDVHQNPEVHS